MIKNKNNCNKVKKRQRLYKMLSFLVLQEHLEIVVELSDNLAI